MTEIGGQGPMGAADPAPSPETVAGATGFGGYHTYGGSPLPGNKKPMRKKMAKGNTKPPSVKLPSLPHELSAAALKETQNQTNDVRVIKHIDGAYKTFANFPIVQDALDYMRRMDFANDSWYIVNADGVRLRLNDQDKLVVFHSLIG